VGSIAAMQHTSSLKVLMRNIDLHLEPEQVRASETIAESGSTPALRRRALILLAYAEGHPTRQVAQEVGLSTGRVCYWRRQFRARGMDIFRTRNSPQETQQPLDPPKRTEIPKGATILENIQTGIHNHEISSSGEPEPVATHSQAIPEDAANEVPPLPEKPEDVSEEAPTGADIQADIITEMEEAGLQTLMEEVKSRDLPFPKTQKSPGLLVDDTLAEAGRKTLLYHFAEMLKHEDGTRLGEDIEELHDMRVASRRMRAAFDLFEQAFDPKVIRRHLRGLKATGRALGAVRDMDVFIEKANYYMEELSPEQRSGLGMLVEAWQAQRETARAAMLAHLSSPEYATFKRKFNVFVQTPGKGIRLLSPECPVPPLARDAAPVLIYSRLAAVRAYDQLLESATLEQLHSLRIEFKKLRYAVEFFREILGREAKQVIGVLKTMQDHLGDLNDAQVATQLLSDFLGHMEFSHLDLPLSERRNPEPVVVYLAAKHAERHRLMRTFPEAWAQFNQPEFRQNLALAIAAL
jgi:CHAD domain-containing protein